MTKPLTNLGLSLGLSAAVGITTAFIAPQYVSAAFVFAGGLLGGTALGKDKEYKDLQETQMANRVTGCFSALYESNRGIVDPVQLSFMANVPIAQAHNFLTQLAENADGQKVPVKTGAGVVFVYPHAQSALDELTTNAKKWAENQTQAMAQDLDQHKRALQYLQLQQTAKNSQAAPASVPAPPSPWENVKP